MAIKAVLFDKDGTLLDYYATWMQVNWKLAEHAAGGSRARTLELMVRGGYDLEIGTIKAGTPLAVGSPIEIAGCFAPEASGVELERLTGEFHALFSAEAKDAATAVPKLKETLETLKRAGYPLGIATTDSEEGIEATLGKFDVLDLFDFKAGYDSGHGQKPSPGMVLAFCEAVGLPPAEVAMVGDNLHDIHMGQSAGAGLLVGVLTGTGTKADLGPHADLVLGSIAELPVALAEMRHPVR